MYFAFILHI